MSQALSRPSAKVIPLPISAGPTAGELADVVGGLHDRPIVVYGATRQPARTALSCLVRPESGDQVLVAFAGGELWVLAVLHRPGDAPLRLITERNLEIAATGGRLTLAARERVDIATPGAAAVTAGALALQARSARASIDDVSHVGERLTVHVGKLKLVGQALETLFERVLTRAKRSYRFVEETDQLRSTEIDHRASETLRVSGRNAFVLAEGVVKMDAGQIHMG
jgi:hypothetical protein